MPVVTRSQSKAQNSKSAATNTIKKKNLTLNQIRMQLQDIHFGVFNCYNFLEMSKLAAFVKITKHYLDAIAECELRTDKILRVINLFEFILSDFEDVFRFDSDKFIVLACTIFDKCQELLNDTCDIDPITGEKIDENIWSLFNRTTLTTRHLMVKLIDRNRNMYLGPRQLILKLTLEKIENSGLLRPKRNVPKVNYRV
jgi:hypothetical protein